MKKPADEDRFVGKSRSTGITGEFVMNQSSPHSTCTNPYCDDGWVYGVSMGDVNLGHGPCEECNEGGENR